MKIILAHNHYGSAVPSGENRVFELERRLLETRGHEVILFERHSDELRSAGLRGILKGALVTPWNPSSFQRMKALVSHFAPDVVHVHNTFPLISPSIFPAARGVARILTLHNYRLFCPAGIPMRSGKVCVECIDKKSAFPSLKFGCYRGSRLATLPLALNVGLHRFLGTWKNEVETFIAVTEFQRSLMIQAGLPANLVSVKPNFFPENRSVLLWEERKPQVVFAGRLSEEKGVETLVAAWIAWGADAPELVLAGDGPLKSSLMNKVRISGSRKITFLGNLSSENVQNLIGASRLLILPSLCFEVFGMVLAEAFAAGTPTVVSDVGPLAGIVGASGVTFRAGSEDSLLAVVRGLWGDTAKLKILANEARLAFTRKYNEDSNYTDLMAIYNEAIARVSR